MNPLSLIFGPVVGAVKELGSLWMKKKIAKVEGEIQIQQRVVAGELDYNTWAQKAGMSSWKDEWLTIWTTALVTAHFMPGLNGYLKNGWDALANVAPDWFGYCFVGMYVAVFGLKGWKIFKQ